MRSSFTCTGLLNPEKISCDWVWTAENCDRAWVSKLALKGLRIGPRIEKVISISLWSAQTWAQKGHPGPYCSGSSQMRALSTGCVFQRQLRTPTSLQCSVLVLCQSCMWVSRKNLCGALLLIDWSLMARLETQTGQSIDKILGKKGTAPEQMLSLSLSHYLNFNKIEMEVPVGCSKSRKEICFADKTRSRSEDWV